MNIFVRSFVFLAFASSVAVASTSNCPTNTTTTISNATIQASPAGCEQVDLQFNLLSPVISTITGDTASHSSHPSDSNVTVTGTGVALGIAANAQALIFGQNGGFSASDTSTGIGQTWTYAFDFGATDLIAGHSITGTYLAFNNLVFHGATTAFSYLEFVCTGTNTFSNGCSGDFFNGTVNSSNTTFHSTLALPTNAAGVKLEIIINLPSTGSGFSFSSFQFGFDEGSSTPEPATWGLIAAGILFMRAFGRGRKKTA